VSQREKIRAAIKQLIEEEIVEAFPKSTFYSLCVNRKIVAKGSKKSMSRLAKNKYGGLKRDKVEIWITSKPIGTIMGDEDDELDEMNVTGNIAGYNVPGAFSAKVSAKGTRKKGYHGGAHHTHEGGHKQPEVFDYTLVEGSINEGRKTKIENRWLELKNDESLNPIQKIGMGVRDMNKQLKEVESFIRWYKRLQLETEINSDKHWKRTQNHVRTMKERIINIAKDIQEIA